jgi:hypothetical protein
VIATMEINHPKTGNPYILLNSMNIQKELNKIFLLDLQLEDGANDLTKFAIIDDDQM